MTNNDLGFVGSIPDLYDRNIGPLMMVPYAGDIAARLSDMATGRLLEVAAGTGIVTAALALALPRAQLIATDLNQPMLDRAATKPELRGVEFRQADALALPFDDQSFDAVVCQFGVMFRGRGGRYYAVALLAHRYCALSRPVPGLVPPIGAVCPCCG